MTQEQKTSRSFAGIAGIIAVATLISKFFGLVREQAIAAAFGAGGVVDAYNFAYMIPSFLLILLGGVNGPFHSAIVSVLARRKQEEAAPLVETMTTLVGGLLLLVTIFLVIFAPNLIDLVAPGLDTVRDGAFIKESAIVQLRIMAPMAVLAGLIGIGFGTLNTANQYWLLSLSPLFSSIILILGLGVLALQLGSKISSPEYAILGGMVLAGGTLAGAFLQWLIQQIAQARAGLGTLRLRFNFKQPGVSDVLKIMGPATFSSGMLQINLYTDMYFASFIPSAPSGLRYSNILVQTPLGIISNIILLPLLPIFSRLAAPENWTELKLRIRQGFILTAFTMLPMGALMMALSDPIVRVVYERGAFNQTDSALVSSILVASGLGMFVYLGRDVLVRVFYALGDGQTPFRVSMINIIFNALLDWILFKPFGAPGLVLATVGVNFISLLMLLWLLDRRLDGLRWREWSLPILGLATASLVGGGASYGTLEVLQKFLGEDALQIQLVQISIAGLVGIGVFAVIVAMMKLPEIEIFVSRLRERFLRR
ncbi:MAG: murein biosynthesis integral membrane protein MurJ [Brasilonema octagenarum HA4186-MV1]|uniref:Probable lipid II flippase MurJ n=2 Tax=Brasilonema TaxID=383614 RepID=A0A856MP54_9CYAN|nr:murein biosynthesis integral membrane protein MurJ [Brasilonema sennae]MBW4629711.1 murein biosynthesis integral membrane protein MurJ [Brasilonema octagenarum HA4186-MV1]NMF67389.1 murein biosynthesis integral membrane protein MurJ [Brasilonema octagenarum UFV-OR1]QDL12312.1 murein biosynthesis integral membrane protein MurJ [Brasilonema sennae CENA114]QDL18693.1 murein biosynthesis integral membrane protein MurJ [Brasilonema octagenarum UFV-E1]